MFCYLCIAHKLFEATFTQICNIDSSDSKQLQMVVFCILICANLQRIRAIYFSVLKNGICFYGVFIYPPDMHWPYFFWLEKELLSLWTLLTGMELQLFLLFLVFPVYPMLHWLMKRFTSCSGRNKKDVYNMSAFQIAKNYNRFSNNLFMKLHDYEKYLHRWMLPL